MNLNPNNVHYKINLHALYHQVKNHSYGNLKKSVRKERLLIKGETAGAWNLSACTNPGKRDADASISDCCKTIFQERFPRSFFPCFRLQNREIRLHPPARES